MTQVNFKGQPVQLSGILPNPGDPIPEFRLAKTDLSDITPADVKGKRVVLNIFPSVDTPVCAASVRYFNQAASQLDNTVVLCISADLPFALGRFCGAEGLENVVPASDMRQRDFGEKNGLRMTSGPLEGLLARAVIVLDDNGQVTYTQLVPEITEEPQYDAVLNHLG